MVGNRSLDRLAGSKWLECRMGLLSIEVSLGTTTVRGRSYGSRQDAEDTNAPERGEARDVV
jgi:hypothetical protein